MAEFEHIRRIVAQHPCHDQAIWLPPGDDCAGITADAADLVMTIDTLVMGQHFEPTMSPNALGHKAAAVSLSDVAAMGAKPCWMLCALTMPDFDAQWRDDFCRGFHGLLSQYDVHCIGGDITAGPICTVTTQCTGQVPKHQALVRHGAQVGDAIYVTGRLGQCRYAYEHLNTTASPIDPVCFEHCLAKLHRPIPHVALGQDLVGLAHACIDVSDGLVGDLAHICRASGVAAVLAHDRIPIAPVLMEHASSARLALEMALYSGDEYELCFTVPHDASSKIAQIAIKHSVALHHIGTMVEGAGISWAPHGPKDLPKLDPQKAWQHFSQQ